MATTKATTKRQAKEKKCVFVSVWEGGIEFKSRAIFHTDTKEIEVLETYDVDGVENLEEEYIMFPDGTIENVCPDCHEGIMETRLEQSRVNSKDKTLYEVTRCSRSCEDL